ncbi:maltose O-acetyltransferase [Anseongella ginsenosidimutans]|uniref:Maltose O-acetyltransferase n=1 Tax=Anseongella ginsenosidimutans TaxID=496056 RepID=A0A4R3KLA1_9SPHI|nr:maltose O-acetyltransferase [Anseongella ginsenosidimutans]
MVSNRIRVWYISKILKIAQNDKNSKFENGIYISNARTLKIGAYVRINENVFLQGKITIGSYVMIAPNVAIYSSTHIYNDKTIPMVLSGSTVPKEVTIHDDVWVGRGAIIMPGITVGRGAIIGANAVVTKDVEEYTIVGGVPAKILKKR